MKKVRLGIIGLGNIGKHHAAYLLEGKVSRAELNAVCSVTAAELENYKGRVLPVLVSPTENVPWFLKTIPWVDVSNPSDQMTVGDRVARALRQLERRAG